MVLHLILTTLSGEEAQLTIELQEFDRLQEFEREQLPETGNSSTFGCELDFLCCNSQQKLVDPIGHTTLAYLGYRTLRTHWRASMYLAKSFVCLFVGID